MVGIFEELGFLGYILNEVWVFEPKLLKETDGKLGLDSICILYNWIEGFAWCFLIYTCSYLLISFAVIKLLLLSGGLTVCLFAPPKVCSLFAILVDLSLPAWERASFSLNIFENISKNFYLFSILLPMSTLCKISFSLGYLILFTYSIIIYMLTLLFLL